jgi:death on curing protein
MVVFLGLNGYDLDAPDAEIVTVMVSVAAGHTSETQLAGWLRRRMTPLE